MTREGAWYWCMHHQRAEDAEHVCRALDRLGPYNSEDEARNWRERAEARNRRWEAEDRRWEGDE